MTFKGHFNRSDKEDFLSKNKKIEINENLKKVKKLQNFPKLKSLLRAPGRNSRAGSKAKTKNEEAYKENSFISKILMPQEIKKIGKIEKFENIGHENTSLVYGEDTLENALGYDETTINNYNSQIEGNETLSPDINTHKGKKKYVSKTEKKTLRKQEKFSRERNFSVHF